MEQAQSRVAYRDSWLGCINDFAALYTHMPVLTPKDFAVGQNIFRKGELFYVGISRNCSLFSLLQLEQLPYQSFGQICSLAMSHSILSAAPRRGLNASACRDEKEAEAAIAFLPPTGAGTSSYGGRRYEVNFKEGESAGCPAESPSCLVSTET